MKIKLMIIVFCLSWLAGFGQNERVEGLMNILKSSKSDTVRINTMNALADVYKRYLPDSSVYFGTVALLLSESKGYKMGAADAYLSLGYGKYFSGNTEDARNNFKKSLALYENLPDEILRTNKQYVLLQKGRSFNGIAITFMDHGNYSLALTNFFNALVLFEKAGYKKGIAYAYGNIGLIYDLQLNYPEAYKYHHAALGLAKELNDKQGMVISYINIGKIKEAQQNHDEASTAYHTALKISTSIGNQEGMAICYNNLGRIEFESGNYHAALNKYSAALELFSMTDNFQGIATIHINIGEIKRVQGKNKEAILSYNKALLYAKKSGLKKEIQDSYSCLAKADSAEGNFKQAFEHFKMFNVYNDSLYNEENTKKLVEAQMKYEYDKKESATKAEHDHKQALAQAEIIRQKAISNIITGGTFVLILSFVFSFFLYLRKREATYKNEVSEVEMKALRAQMNPHFIFNSLNSIHRFMEKKETEAAGNYLGKFAKVMRLILENSESKEVPLEDDLKALELYMQLEAVRMDGKFTYEIHVDDHIDRQNTLIPPLILQPYVENAIWHGIANKEGNGKIIIHISSDGEMLHCMVEDDGIGRVKSFNPEAEKNEKKSLGMKITKARIDILNKIKKSNAGIDLLDLTHGMRVMVKLPLELAA